MRLGDLVINRQDPRSMLFQVTGFDEDKVIVKVIGLPLTTVLPLNNVLKISSVPITPPLRVIQGGENSPV